MPKTLNVKMFDARPAAIPHDADVVIFADENENVTIVISEDKWEELRDWVKRLVVEPAKNWREISEERKFILYRSRLNDVWNAVREEEEKGGRYES